jgi:hypothetical protein
MRYHLGLSDKIEVLYFEERIDLVILDLYE